MSLSRRRVVLVVGVALSMSIASCASDPRQDARPIVTTTDRASDSVSSMAPSPVSVSGSTDDGSSSSGSKEDPTWYKSASVTSDQRADDSVVVSEPTIGQTIPIGSGSSSLASAGGVLWVATSDSSRVTAFSSDLMTVVAHFDHPDTKHLFVESDVLQACSDTDLVTVDPATRFVTSTVPVGCTGGATGGNGYWSEDGAQIRYVTTDGQVYFGVDIGHPGAVSLSGGSVWIADSDNGPGTISRVDYGLRQIVATVATPGPTSNILATPSAVWVTVDAAGPDDVSLLEIDPNTNTVVATYTGGGLGGSIDLAGHFVWAAYANGTVLVIDADTHQVVDRLTVPAAADPNGASTSSIASFAGAIFIATPGSLTRIAPGSFGPADESTVTPVRATVSDSCPESITEQVFQRAGSGVWFINPDRPDLHDSLVPGDPTSVVVCRYAEITSSTTTTGATGYSGGTLISRALYGQPEASQLAAAANAIPPAIYVHGGLAMRRGPVYTLLAFHIPGRDDIDVALVEDAHPNATNGFYTADNSGEFTNLMDHLDALIPPAPNRTSE